MKDYLQLLIDAVQDAPRGDSLEEKLENLLVLQEKNKEFIPKEHPKMGKDD